MPKKDPNDELRELLDTVAAEVTSFMKSEGLTKAHDGEAVPSEVPPNDSATSDLPPSADGPPSDAPLSDGGPPPASDEGTSPPASDEGAPPDGDAPPGDGADPAADQGGDVESLAREYDKLPLEEHQAHYMACRSSLMAKMAAQGGGDGSEGAPPDAAAPPSAPAAPPSASAPPSPDMSAMKSELAGLKGQLQALTKSLEQRDVVIATTKGLLDQLQRTPRVKGVDFASPMRKSEAGKAPEDMDRDEIVRRLRFVAARPDLKKSEQAAITAFCVGSVGLDKVRHLLVEAA